MASVHHHELSTDSEGPRRSTAAQQPPAEHARSAWFQSKSTRPQGARGRCTWTCELIPTLGASSARTGRAVRDPVDRFAAVARTDDPHS